MSQNLNSPKSGSKKSKSRSPVQKTSKAGQQIKETPKRETVPVPQNVMASQEGDKMGEGVLLSSMFNQLPITRSPDLASDLKMDDLKNIGVDGQNTASPIYKNIDASTQGSRVDNQ